MIHEVEFYTDENDCTIINDGVDINYGWLCSIVTESGLMLVIQPHHVGVLIEFLGKEPFTLSPFDGKINTKLVIHVGDTGVGGSIYLWPVDNDHVDRLCRLLATQSGKEVRVESHARILARYNRDVGEIKEKSHGLDHFYLDVDPEILRAVSWPRMS